MSIVFNGISTKVKPRWMHFFPDVIITFNLSFLTLSFISFKDSNDVDLFKLLNSNFIYETNTAAYQVFYLFLNLLFTDPDVITYLSNEIYLVKVLSEVSLTIVLVLMSNCCYISGYNSIIIILIYLSLLFYFSSCVK